MYEIYEERLVVQDGKVPDRAVSHHHALVWSERGGTLRVASIDASPESLLLEVEEPSEDGDVTVGLNDLQDAVAALRRLRGADVPPDRLYAMRERAATVVERACEILEANGDTGATLAADLRATSLQLIDMATSGDRGTPELQSEAK